ncbi:hypothetical protein [Winogradskya consettensis]|uniref:hypothetical protein n=1 Tax=Winogradskya consettensis TaxID=113560 RepID=UPI001BB44790|nr:hypothetical protein [Actinoplanes consettensis]
MEPRTGSFRVTQVADADHRDDRRVLAGVLGVGRAAEQPDRNSAHPRVVPGVEGREALQLTPLSGPDQLGVVGQCAEGLRT